jgi:NAD(P)-dependent dehydrogenase (short-subunit alcohol dehydrogenase family)
MPQSSAQKTLLLTGASRGIGHATVQRFDAEGWRVISCSRQPFSEHCPWPGGEANHVQVDLTDPNQTMLAVEDIRSRLQGGLLHALVNNAGISPKAEDGGRLNTLDTDLRTWGQIFHVNFFASVILARGLKEELSAAKGAIVNVTSIAGVRVHPFAGEAYSTSKAALAALTREMAHDFGPLGVRVNAIAPGEVETSILSPGTEKLSKSCPCVDLVNPRKWPTRSTISALIRVLTCRVAKSTSTGLSTSESTPSGVGKRTFYKALRLTARAKVAAHPKVVTFV